MKKYGVEGREKRRSKGITLMALVITVIVLLILASITISTFSGNSIITQTKKAKEEADINSEIKLIGTSSNQAKNRDKYGDLKEDSFIETLTENVGKGKTEVKFYADQKVFSVKFVDSERIYFVNAAGNAKYIGKLSDAIMITASPEKSWSQKNEYNVNVIITSFAANNIDHISYSWATSKDDPKDLEFKQEGLKTYSEVENGKITTEPITIKKKINENDGGVEKGDYYLYIKVTKSNGEIEESRFGPYSIGNARVELAIDPNGGEWNGKKGISTIEKDEGEIFSIVPPFRL